MFSLAKTSKQYPSPQAVLLLHIFSTMICVIHFLALYLHVRTYTILCIYMCMYIDSNFFYPAGGMAADIEVEEEAGGEGWGDTELLIDEGVYILLG